MNLAGNYDVAGNVSNNFVVAEPFAFSGPVDQ
jgi:hypothetical protein